MNTYKVIFTIKQSIHPLTETVQAETVKAAEQIVREMVTCAGLTTKQIVSIIQQ